MLFILDPLEHSPSFAGSAPFPQMLPMWPNLSSLQWLSNSMPPYQGRCVSVAFGDSNLIDHNCFIVSFIHCVHTYTHTYLHTNTRCFYLWTSVVVRFGRCR